MTYKYFLGRKWYLFNSLSEIRWLPNFNGAYLIRIKEKGVRNWKIIYAGETRSIWVRISVHSVIQLVKRQATSNSKSIKIQVLFCPMEGLKRKRLEQTLIYTFCPMFNYIEKNRRSGKWYELNHTKRNKYMWLKEIKPTPKIENTF